MAFAAKGGNGITAERTLEKSMQVICPGCQSCFLLPAGVKNGTILRCSVCKKEFPYTGPDVPSDLPSASLQEPAVSPEPAEAALPSMDAQPQPVQEAPSTGTPLNFDQPAPAGDFFQAKGHSGELPVLGGKEKKGHGLLWLSLLVLICLAGVAGWYTVPEFRSFLQECQPSLFGNDSAKPAPAAKSQPDAASSAKSAAADPKQPAGQTAEKPLVLDSVSHRFVDNDNMGSILIIDGKVKNVSQNAYGNIILHAALLDKDHKVIDTADQQAGTVLTDFQLKVMTKAEMVKALGENAGAGASGGTVATGGTIPFMVLFTSPSDAVSELAIEIGKSEALPSEGTNAQPAGAPTQSEPVQPAPSAKDTGNSQQPKPVLEVPDKPVLSAPAPAPLSPASGQQPSVPQTVPPSVQPTVQ